MHSTLRTSFETFGRALRAALRELAHALGQPGTYDLARNVHAWIGLALALPVSFVLLALALGGARDVADSVTPSPPEASFVALAAGIPLATAVFAGALGSAEARSRRRVLRLKRALWRSRQETRRACARLGQLDETKRRLVAAVSHELRTPLTAITGYADMLAAGRLGRLEPPQERAVAVLRRAVEREKSAVENLIAYVRLETASYRPESAALDLRDPVRRAHGDLLDLARRRGVVLALELPLEPVPVEADPTGLVLVVGNLVSNAVQMTPRGGRAWVRVATDGGRARVTVTDTGPGVPRDIAPRIFEPFFQALGGDTREKGGAGLGLAIVKGVLEAHGTSVALDEPPGGGARFTFGLPLLKESRSLLAARVSSAGARPPA